MARSDLGGIANRLFEQFLAPLVLGGPMVPGRPIGAQAALAMGRERVLADPDLASHVRLARTRVARRLVAIDRVGDPTEAEWALGSALHDLVQSTHPGLRGAFRRSAPAKILALVEATVARVPPPASAGEALSRHSLFARLFAIERTDTIVRWWTGSQTFLGEVPPVRLMAWPELRRVNVDKSSLPLLELTTTAGALDPPIFQRRLTHFLSRTPLTDLATLGRAAPRFAWSRETLSLIASRAGRTLAFRALASLPDREVDAGLGRATRALLRAAAWSSAAIALDLLADRAFAQAESADGHSDKPLVASDLADDAVFAQAAGALVARQTLGRSGNAHGASERGRLLALLEPRARSAAAREVEALLARRRP